MRVDGVQTIRSNRARTATYGTRCAVSLPAGSSDLPAGSGGPPSIACANRLVSQSILLDLAPGGVYLAAPVTRNAGGLLHRRFTLTESCDSAVCFLWHCPAGHPGLLLATTLPCGARTFLG